MRAPASQVPAATRDESHQRLRLRRFVLASTVSLLYLAALLVFHWQGKVDRDTLFSALALVTMFVAVFFLFFRFGWNLRFSDPSLTTYQVLAAVVTMLFVVYRAPGTRIVFAGFFFVALMFGLLRASVVQLAVLGSMSLAAFALVALARYAGNEDVEMLRLDMLQLVVTAIAFPWFVFIGSRVRRLNEADRRKDVFLATLSHELRNPLAPIGTGIHILRRTVAEPHAQSVLPMMERQLQHLTRLLDELLDVSRITRGKIALHIERVDLAGALQAAVEASQPLIQKMGHELVIGLPEEPVALDADPVRLAQVVSNLLNNAARYTPRGGRIELKARRQGSQVQVSVCDNGVGIPREHLESVFDMFMQVESHASGSQGGLGIGLALAKGLVELHGGTVEAHSEGAGRGSEFRVCLPLTARRRLPAR